MKKALLLSFLILIFSCSNDNDEDFDTLPNNLISSPHDSDNKIITLSISQSDDTSLTSCPEVSDFSYLIKDNSLISGVIGSYGELETSSDNTIYVYSCTFSSTENNNFIIQRFGGLLTLKNDDPINLEGRLEINRQTQQVYGVITIKTLKSNDSNTYNVMGNINEYGSCEIENYPQR